MKLVKLTILSIIFCLLLPSCAKNSDDARYTGMLANESVVSSIRQDIEDKENSLLASNGDVFWTESGKLWHGSYKCSYLANSKTILHGTIEEAKLAGKEKACERCSSGDTSEIYEELESRDYHSGDVFFTKEGNVWHININCKIIVGAQKIYFADVSTAKLLGKAQACSECEH